MQFLGQAMDVQMADVQIADVQCDQQPPSAWPTGLRSRWCLPPFPPCRPRPWKLWQHKHSRRS